MSLLISKEEFSQKFFINGVFNKKNKIEYKCDSCGLITLCQLRNWLKKRNRTELKTSLDLIDTNAFDLCSRCTVKNSYTPALRAFRAKIFKAHPSRATHCNITFLTCPGCGSLFIRTKHSEGWRYMRCKECFIPGKDWMSKIGTEEKNKLKEKMSARWTGSKNPQFGKLPRHGKWTVLKLNDKEIRFRSRWEAAFAVCLFCKNISFEYENEIIIISDGESYTPDFKIGDTYYEIKGYWRPGAKNKIDLASKIISIKVIEKDELSIILGFNPKNKNKLISYIKPFIISQSGYKIN